MSISKLTPVFYYAGPADPTGGGGGAAAVADPPAAQPTPGQGSQDDGGGSDFWGMFPNVPEEMRGQLEPHLKQVQGHVTRVEQQLAQFKPILDSGYTPDQIQGLVKFSTDFDQKPLETWLRMAAALQEPGPDGQAIISDDLDIEILAKIAMGQDLDDDEPGAVQPPVGQGQPVQPGNLPPEVVEAMQAMQTRLEAAEAAVQRFEQQREADQTQAQQAAQTRLLNQQLGTIKQTLIDGGYPSELLEDDPETGANGTQLMRAALITANGNAENAIKLLQTQRASILKGFTQDTTGKPAPLKVDEVPRSPRRTREPKDSWEKGRAGATKFLRSQKQQAAQG